MRLRSDESGNVLITVVLISMIVGALASMTLVTGTQADRASASDRNHTLALAAAEAGVHQAIAKIEGTITSSYINDATIDFSGSTPNGSYNVDIQRAGDGFTILATGREGPARLGRSRRVKVTLEPPDMFPDAGYALFSSTNLYLKNNDEVYAGDVWANDSVWAENGARIEGSITSAQSWIKLEQNSVVTGYLWSGGRKCLTTNGGACTSGWSMDLGSGVTVGTWVKASVSAPTCNTETQTTYKINGGQIAGDATAAGAITGSVGGTRSPTTCSIAPAAKPAPTFTFNRFSYDPATYHRFESAALFNSWLSSNNSNLKGTFVVQECSTPRGTINMSGTQIGGDVTIVTNPEPCPDSPTVLDGARVNVDGVDDDAVPSGSRAAFVVISHHRALAGAVCTVSDSNACAISSKNHFDTTCKTSSLIYADNGPVAMKNDTGPGTSTSCGSVIAAGIQMKNNLKLTYDPMFERVLGIGPTGFNISRWEEVRAS